MQFIVKRDILLKSLNFVQGVVEKKNTLPILSNVLLQLKDNKLSIIATDLDIIFYDEISDVKIISRLQNRGRNDDKPELIINRLNVYRKQTEPLLDFYSEKKLLDTINGDQHLEGVNNNILNVLREKVI